MLVCVEKGHVFPLLTEFMEVSDQRRLQMRPPVNTNCHKSLQAFHLNFLTYMLTCASDPWRKMHN